jgi:hypothetical protein
MLFVNTFALTGRSYICIHQPRAPLRLPWARELLGFQPALAHAPRFVPLGLTRRVLCCFCVSMLFVGVCNLAWLYVVGCVVASHNNGIWGRRPHGERKAAPCSPCGEQRAAYAFIRFFLFLYMSSPELYMSSSSRPLHGFELPVPRLFSSTVGSTKLFLLAST